MRRFNVMGACLGTLLITALLFSVQAPAAEQEAAHTFVQLCDTQLGFGGYEEDKQRFRAAVDTINALKPDWVVICGDLVNIGSDDKAVADFREILKGFTIPCHLVSGNHDVGGVPTAASLARYRKLQGKDYYAVDVPGFKLLVLNTQLWKASVPEESARHDAWYRAELAKAKKTGVPVLLASHYPPFLAEPGEKEIYYNLPLEARKSVLTAAAENGVRAWLAGHVHKNIITQYEDIAIVASATTSKNFDGAPYGFRIWTVDSEGKLSHEYVALDLPEELMKPKETKK
ncbi:MAG: metallophosphoesterase [Candidatus Hydrogenedentes bacterium]|nr:metallophosphoesterase [Candidatus Hydrogenedentota bacterium]